MRDLPLNAIRAFAAAYETGGVRPAARALQVTHSSVSRHLRELEAWLGLPLLHRGEGARTLAFTPQGEALGRAALKSLRDLESAAAGLRESRRSNAVTVSTTPSLAARWLLPRLPAFARRHPRIELSVVGDQTLADPADQGADLAIRMGHGPWPDLECEALMDDALFPVMSPAFWHTAGTPRTVDRLADLRLLHDRDPNAAWEQWRAVHGPSSLNIRPGPRFASSDLVLRAAAQALGVALARGRLAADDIAAGTLLRPFGDLQVDLQDAYWIVRPPTAPPRVAADAVIAWLREQARTNQLDL